MEATNVVQTLSDAGAEFMLFGVRVKVDPMRKSVSLNNLSQYEAVNPQTQMIDATTGDGKGESLGYVSADDGVQRQQSSGGGRERKRGVPWTEEEHKLFLLGLQKVGKGDWRGISRNFVKTRTPTQVASHAQKYFLRRSNINRRRRRSSLFDITTDSVTAIPMEEKVHQKHKFQPMVSPTQLPLSETSIVNGSQVFPVTMCPVSLPIQMDNPLERFTFGHLGQFNITEVAHQVPVKPIQSRMVDLNLNQRDFPPLSLNLSLSLDQVQDQFPMRPPFQTNGDSMISVS